MPSERTLKLRKENRNWIRNEKDIEAIYEDKLLVENNKLEKIINEDKLKDVGGIEEAVAVISEKGLQSLLQMFSNSIDNTVDRKIEIAMQKIDEHIQQQVKDAVKNQMAEILYSMINGLNKGYSRVSQSINLEDKKEEFEINPKQKPEQKPEQLIKSSKDNLTIKSSDDRYKEVYELIKSNGTMRMKELTEKVYMTSNPSAFMKRVLEKYPDIKKIERGLYGIKEEKEET